MAKSLVDENAAWMLSGRTNLEKTWGRVRFTAAANTIAKVKRTMFVDNVGQSQESGLVQTKTTSSIHNGKWHPTHNGAIYALNMQVISGDGAILALTDVERLLAHIKITQWRNSTSYDAGLPLFWPSARSLTAPSVDVPLSLMFQHPFLVQKDEVFKTEFELEADLTGLIGAASVFDLIMFFDEINEYPARATAK